MLKLSKDQIKERDNRQAAVNEAIEGLRAAITEYNDAVRELYQEKVQPLVDELNSAIEEADQWRQEIRSDMENFYEEKSERWQEGERGQGYQGWMDSFDRELEQVELEEPADLDEPGNLDDNLEILTNGDDFPEEPQF